MSVDRSLRVFLCHSSLDKPVVRKLYQELKNESWIDPWFDEECLLPGQDFDLEISKAMRNADAIVVCLSTDSVAREGYINKEIRRALDISEEKPEGTIYVIPLRLDNCNPSFERLKKLQWLDYFVPAAHEKLLKSLNARAVALKIRFHENENCLDLYSFAKIVPQKNPKISYSFWMGKYPVTNSQYERFLKGSEFSNPIYWLDIPRFDENCIPIGDAKQAGLDWLQKELKGADSKVLLPRYWYDSKFGITNPTHPVVGISWYEASAYCEWLFQNWNNLSESKANLDLKPKAIRLPLETEWVTAAGGDEPKDRYPWDIVGQATSSRNIKDILRRTNTSIEDLESITLNKSLQYTSVLEAGIGCTTPVNKYPLGKSLSGLMDMSGNVFEWQANFHNKEHTYPALRGGSWDFGHSKARVAYRGLALPPHFGYDSVGFRVAIYPLGQ